eukprot:CAMPEP_0174943442 /NCGR_PEP_ID=MMETSP1355-20121228/76692_1 /TAXON_ID=464990 /ORGANISM="Hemiselmis tepida, Strain CCMP443" /LENGTH=65 /DNA_ID=CAMNT_0016190689 /DNA_START=43 /DNA_END=236 /DNA_ORIENTATION=-
MATLMAMRSSDEIIPHRQQSPMTVYASLVISGTPPGDTWAPFSPPSGLSSASSAVDSGDRDSDWV